MSRSTVLHVIDALNIGGAQELLALLASSPTQRCRMAVCAFQPSLEMKERIEARGVPVYALNRPRPSLRTSPFRFLSYVLQNMLDVIRLRRECGADVVHCHLSDAEFIGVLAGRLSGARKVAMTVHTPLLFPEEHGPGDFRNRLRLFAMRRIYRLADTVVAVSEETLGVLRHLVGIRSDKLAHIPNGVACRELAGREVPEALRGELAVRPGERVVLNLGRLTPQKGQIHLIRAFSRLAAGEPGLKLLVAGDGPLRAELEAEIERLGLTGRAFLLGGRDDVPDLLALADVVAVSSLWEGTSLSLMEAMAAGKPLAVTDIPGNTEILENGVSALMAAPGEPGALAGAIGRLLDDQALAKRLGAAAQAKAEDQCDIGRVCAAYEALWN